MLAIDTVLQNRYRIVHELGQGGMGAVYQALDERLNKTVAIKEVVFEFETADDINQRNLRQKAFQREANSLVKARHEAVPDITDFFSERERLYLVMEYIEGDDLAKMLEKRGNPFSFAEVSPWINQLLEALQYLHNLVPPILHRDIKPQNLKLNERGKIKLLDFGIARSTDKNSTLSQHTFLAATLNYAPFEQVLRVIDPMFREFILLKHRDKAEKFLAQDTDARCDVFGVGATFYHLLTNQIPADVTRRALGIWEKGRDELVNPSEINPEIPPGISAWLMKAMAFERENRFTSASEMKEALQKITVESPAKPPVFGRLEEAIIAREQQLMQAKTESFSVPKKTEEENFHPDRYPSTAGSAVQFEATDAFTPGEFAVTDLNTDLSAQAASVNLTDRSFISENPSFISEKPLIQEPETRNDEIRPPQTKKSANNNRKYILILLVMGFLVVAVSGVGLYVVFSLMNNERQTPKENKAAIENINTAQTPEPTPSVKENVNLTTANNAINTTTNVGTNTAINTETTPNTAKKEPQKTPTTAVQPTVTPTPRIIVEQTPKSTPTVKPTPTAKPTVIKTPSQQGAIKYVVCYVKSENGTIDKIRKNKCSECPAKTACELIFDP